MQHTLNRTTSKYNSVIILVLAMLLAITLVTATISWNDTPKIVGIETYTVQADDTLWGIAKMSNGYNYMDTREIVDDIMELSNCTANIQRRQTVYIPIYEVN